MYKPEQNPIINEETESLIELALEKDMVLGRGWEKSIGTDENDSYFRDNDVIESLTIGGNIEEVKGFAFFHCQKLKRVCLLGSVKRLKIAAFECCHNIDIVYIPNTIEEIDPTAFCDSDKNTVFVFYDNGGENDLNVLKERFFNADRENTTSFLYWDHLSDEDRKIEIELREESEDALEGSVVGALDWPEE